jgi:hypothetical protein
MHWNIASFLPPSLREHFDAVVSEFIFRPWKREHGGGLDDDDGGGGGGEGSGGGGDSSRHRRSGADLDEEGDEVLDEPSRRERGYSDGNEEVSTNPYILRPEPCALRPESPNPKP